MSNENKFQHLFQPAKIGSMALKNRIIMAPMTTNFGTEEGGVTQRLINYYEHRARGGAGLVIVEATSIESPRGRGLDYQLAFDDDAALPQFARLARAIHRHDAKAALQIYHAGLTAEIRTTHMQGVGPSASGDARELTIAEIKQIVRMFADTAERARTSGFDGVEIHAAHYYLLAHFLSPAWNRRRDVYGGSLVHRARLTLEILGAIRARVGSDYPVWVRINGREYGLDNALTLDDSRAFAGMLERAGTDAIHVSGVGAGPFTGYSSGIMYDPPGNLTDLAAAVKKEVSVPVIAVGKLSLEMGEKLVEEGSADLIALGRPFLADPDIVKKAKAGKTEDIRPCLSCRLCGDIMLWVKRTGTRCQVNAQLGREREYAVKPARRKKNVVVVGGGPAGMETARVAAMRGHSVTLYEKEPELGGQMVLASMPPFKSDVRAFIDYLTKQVAKLDVKVCLSTEATPSLIQRSVPDALVLATGVNPFIPRIPGIDGRNVIRVEDALKGDGQKGKRIVIIGGGMVGCELADCLAERGAQVTIAEMLPELAIGLGSSVRTRLLGRLSAWGVIPMTGTRCVGITDEGLTLRNGDGEQKTVTADAVVLAVGSKPNRQLMSAVGGLFPETYLVGDCVEPRRILEAVTEGFRIGLRL